MLLLKHTITQILCQEPIYYLLQVNEKKLNNALYSMIWQLYDIHMPKKLNIQISP